MDPISQHHSSVMPEASKPKEITDAEVKNLFQLWNSALAKLDSDAVTKRYAKKALLLPTVSDIARTDYDTIKHYFDDFLKKKPQGQILESHVNIGSNICQDVGIYEFTMGSTGHKVKERYSFVYTWEDGQWKILHHHSSVMPEAFLGPHHRMLSMKELGIILDFKEQVITIDRDTLPMRDTTKSAIAKE
jgi:uncharacterized protein (TIGR02246 family)